MDYEERQALRNRRINVSVGMSLTLVEVIDRIADSENNRSSLVVERLIRRGLEVERAEREKAR